MDKVDLKEMKEDWLAGNSVVAFVGALLVGQSWEVSEGTVQLFRILTVPSYTGLILLAVVVVLFGLSLTFALASLATPLQNWAIDTATSYSTVLWWVVCFSFLLSLGYAFEALPSQQWWTPVLHLGGVGMMLFIMFRIGQGPRIRPWIISVYRRLRRFVGFKPIDDARPRDPDNDEKQKEPEQNTLLDRVRAVLVYRRLPESRGFWIGLSVLLGVVGLAISVCLWDWLRGDQSGGEAIRNVGLVIAGLVAFPLAIWRALAADRQASAAQRQTATAQQDLLNERYQKGADMLGNEILSVRLGGIYALQSLASEHPEQYYVQCMRLLCAFVRNPPKHVVVEEYWDIDDRSDIWMPTLREDVQAVMDALRNRNETHIALEKEAGFVIDLRFADLSDSFLYGINLSRSELTMVNLSGAYLKFADFSGANLSGANLSNARLAGADLSGTAPIKVNVSGTKFCEEGHSENPTFPTIGLTQYLLDLAYADPDDPPVLGGDARDAHTGRPLVWRSKSS